MKTLHDAGARLLLGSDTPNPFVVPGFSIHQELQNLVDSGLTPYESIKAGTHDAAEFLDALDLFGTISPGRPADLILVDGNPLDDVANVARRSGVMLRGRWLAEDELQSRLEELADSYGAPKAPFADLPPLPTEGEPDSGGHFELFFNDTSLGEERFAVERIPDGRRVIFAQAVTDPPAGERTALRLEFDTDGVCYTLSYRSETATGETRLEMVRTGGSLTVTGTLASGEVVDLEETIAEDTLLDAPLMAAVVPMIEYLRTMGVGESKVVHGKSLQLFPDFGVVDQTLTVTRSADETVETTRGAVTGRVYEIEVVSPNATFGSTLVLDESWHILSLAIEQQMGVVSFRPIE